MAYQTYITEALVCGSDNRNTSDRNFLLFTREGGMVWANARSVRLERSKQRYGLQPCSYVRMSLVSGKAGWHIAGVEPLQNMYYLAEGRQARALVRNTIQLLRRVLQGEVPYQAVFDDVITTLQKCNEYDRDTLETVLSFRILNSLGYVSPRDEQLSVLSSTHAFSDIESITEKEIALYKEMIEESLHASQL
ncbi:recombination protein O N-terminal domain-containing protein [bacterium]|nr:recombination protein O N-terminal domain-containing protein [bacterium]